MFTQTELKAVRANLAKIQQGQHRTDKLAELLNNVSELTRLTPYIQPQSDLATKGEMMELEKEVKSAHTASLIRSGTTSEYARYMENAERGLVDAHPDAKHNTHAEITAQLRSSPELRELARGLGGLTKADLKKDLPS